MAIVKSKRNVAKGTLDYLDKKELVATYLLLNKEFNDYEEDVKKQIGTYESELKSLKLKIKEESDRVEQLQRSLTLFVTDEYTKKQILRLYAMGNSTTLIYNTLNKVKQIDVTFETISDIITNLKNKDLEQCDLDYYTEESKRFLENSPNFEEEYRLNQIRQILENQEKINGWVNKIENEGLDEEKSNQIRDLVSLMKLQGENAKSLSAMMKGTNGSNFGNENVNTAKDIRNQLENHSKSIVENFDPSAITKVN